MFTVVVPNASEITFDVSTSGYVNVSAEPPPVIHVPLTAKHPAVRLKPTLEVEVAEPEIFRPETVVVPKPVAETERSVVEA